MKVDYEIKIGDLTLKGGEAPATELARLDIRRSALSPSEGGEIVLHAPRASGGGLLDAALGAAADQIGGAVAGLGGGGAPPAFDVGIRGVDIESGAKVSVSIQGHWGTATIITGEVTSIVQTSGQLRIGVATAMLRLARARIGRGFQNQTAGQIVRALCSDAGVDAGQTNPGEFYSAFHTDPRRSVFETLARIAAREGMDMGVDSDGKFRMTTFRKLKADHVIRYGVEALWAEVRSAEPAMPGIAVVGEGALASAGPMAWSWPVADPAGVAAAAGTGGATLSDGAIRSRSAAETAASSRAGAMRDRARRVSLRVLGTPTLALGDAIELTDMPYTEMNGMFKIDGLTHRFGPETGFTTDISGVSTGGAGLMAGLLGGLAGGLAGGLGL